MITLCELNNLRHKFKCYNKNLSSGKIVAFSAGVKRAEQVNSKAVEVMREIGIDGLRSLCLSAPFVKAGNGTSRIPRENLLKIQRSPR